MTFDKIISKQRFFVFESTTNLQFSIIQNEINESLVTISDPVFTGSEVTIYIVPRQMKALGFWAAEHPPCASKPLSYNV